MLVKCWQTAILAATMALMSGTARSQCAAPEQTSGNILNVNRNDVFYVGEDKATVTCVGGESCSGCCARKNAAAPRTTRPAPLA